MIELRYMYVLIFWPDQDLTIPGFAFIAYTCISVSKKLVDEIVWKIF